MNFLKRLLRPAEIDQVKFEKYVACCLIVAVIMFVCFLAYISIQEVKGEGLFTSILNIEKTDKCFETASLDYPNKEIVDCSYRGGNACSCREIVKRENSYEEIVFYFTMEEVSK